MARHVFRLVALCLITTVALSSARNWRKSAKALGQNGPFTQTEKDAIVKKHNDCREQVGASNMNEIVWDDELAGLAAQLCETCDWGHDFTTMDDTKVGQNLAMQLQFLFSPEREVDKWCREKRFFDPSSLKCQTQKHCDEYEQVVWATTSKVGCAKCDCARITGKSATRRGPETILSDAEYFVCDYLPSRVGGGHPYNQGAPCSECPEGSTCHLGLCVVPDEDVEDLTRREEEKEKEEKMEETLRRLLELLGL